VRYPTKGGDFPAWWIAGERDTTVIAVHGRGTDIAETVPALEVAVAAGYPVLAIRYRNDPGTLISPGRRATFGEKEWHDLESATRFALQRGASTVIIVGYSMGGAIALNFMRESRLASRVSGVVLESPALSLGEMIDHRVGQVVPGDVVGLPQALSWGAKRIASWQYDVDWDAIDFRTEPLSADIPILLFHGTKDTTVPIELSEMLAAQYPRLITFERMEGAGHIGAASFDRLRQDRAFRALLARASPESE